VNVTKPISFSGERSVFSNFYPCEVSAFGISYKSVEAAYLFIKAVFHGEFDTARYVNDAPTGGVAKRRSKRVLQTRRSRSGREPRV